MAQFTWVFDAPTGTYKEHDLSARLYEAAIEDSVFMDHVTPIGDYGKKQGESVTLTRVKNITEPSSAVLTETDRIPEDEFQLTTTSITVQEIGRSVPYTSLSQDLSAYDLMNPIQKKLTQQMTLYLDTLASNAFRQSYVKYVPTGATSSSTDTGAADPTTTATANMNVWHVEELRDLMYDTYHIPMRGDSYVGIFRTLGLRGIKRDADWEEWHKYTNPAAKFNSEVGKLEDVRFVETNHANALGKVGTSSVLGEGVVFGEDAVAMAEAQTPELRAAMPADFGRSKAVAWYGILAFQLIWDANSTAGEVKVVHVDSA